MVTLSPYEAHVSGPTRRLQGGEKAESCDG
jgi:hypothetical protein